MSNEIKRFAHTLNLQLFADDPQDPPADPPEPKDASPKKLEMTQEEFDAKIAERLARERKKYADYDDIKTKLTTLEQAEDERKKADMSEKERLEAEKAEALKKAEEAAAERDRTLQAANQRLVKAEFRAQARELGVRADALDDAYILADLSAVKVDDEGNVNGVKDVVEALLKNKPFLAEQAKKEPKQIGEGSNHDDKGEQKTKEQLLKEAADKARKSGKPEDMAAYSALKIQLGS
ncbi:scaffolding protein [Paenibacillus naphthalenovorans]|uniref:phage scaffolding protein n=1 Tax=Paenibacillus naphthalenovorans TaxID=162209 RepID=UPI003D26AD6D